MSKKTKQNFKVMNFFNKTMGLLLGSNEENKSMINHQMLIKKRQPILIVKKEDE